MSIKLCSSSSDEYIVVSDFKMVLKASNSIEETADENYSIMSTAMYNTNDVTCSGNCSTTTYEGYATHDAVGDEKKLSIAVDSS